jgi:hypothetical protein
VWLSTKMVTNLRNLCSASSGLGTERTPDSGT